MKVAILAFATLCVFFTLAAGCAGAPVTQNKFNSPDEALTDCRDFVGPGETKPRNVCGTPEQWAELERRIALVEAGVTCREMLTGSTSNVLKTFCYTPAQWEVFEREQARESMEQMDGRRGMAGGY